MPHVAISMFPGRDEKVKSELAIKVQQFLSEELHIDPKVVSVSIEDIQRDAWADHMKKYRKETLFVKPQM